MTKRSRQSEEIDHLIPLELGGAGLRLGQLARTCRSSGSFMSPYFSMSFATVTGAAFSQGARVRQTTARLWAARNIRLARKSRPQWPLAAMVFAWTEAMVASASKELEPVFRRIVAAALIAASLTSPVYAKSAHRHHTAHRAVAQQAPTPKTELTIAGEQPVLDNEQRTIVFATILIQGADVCDKAWLDRPGVHKAFARADALLGKYSKEDGAKLLDRGADDFDARMKADGQARDGLDDGDSTDHRYEAGLLSQTRITP